jgi:hypothetical protein
VGSAGGTWLQRAAAAGADVVRINIGWPAPDTRVQPAGFDARDPGDPRYDFSAADAAIEAATARGLRVIAQFTGAPRWAEGPGMPADASPGTWRPEPGALHDYAIALGRRYSGHYPDPLHPGTSLPRVWAFQVWNEPNLSTYLEPQWAGGRPASPGLYRSLLNAFYSGLKSVDPGALVVTAGTAPFGDPEPGGLRIMPARFWREVLCLRQSGARLAGTACPSPAHFDVLAHHPYSIGVPTTHAYYPDEVSIPDMGKLTRLLRAAERTGRALPRIHHPIWVTETSYDSSPPDPHGVPIVEQAHWLEQTLCLLWRQGVSLITWFQVGDQPPVPSYAATNQSGVYYLDGRPKPALQAFRFPLVGWRAHGAVEVWGRAPASGEVAIQHRLRGVWSTELTLRVHAGSTFLAPLVDSGDRAVTIRATIAGQTSLTWVVR